METDGQYSAESALRDAADVRTRATATADIRLPIGYHAATAVVFPLLGLNVVLASPWRFVVPLAGILVATAIAYSLQALMDRRGAHVKTLDGLRRSPATLTVLVVGGVAFVAIYPLTEAFGWSPWVPPLAGLGYGLLWLLLNVRVDQRRRAEAQRALRVADGTGGDGAGGAR